MVSTVIPVPPFDLVIFGATGDLAHRKILPSLYRRLAAHQVPAGSRIIGAARAKMSREEFQNSIRDSLMEFIGGARLDTAVLEAFLKRGDTVSAVFCAPEKEGAKPDALRVAAEAAGLKVHQFKSLRAPEAPPQQVATVPEALRGERGRRSPDS